MKSWIGKAPNRSQSRTVLIDPPVSRALPRLAPAVRRAGPSFGSIRPGADSPPYRRLATRRMIRVDRGFRYENGQALRPRRRGIKGVVAARATVPLDERMARGSVGNIDPARGRAEASAIPLESD